MYHQKGFKLLKCFILFKQEIALWQSLIFIQLYIPLYMLLDVFLKMRVLAPEIQCSGARIPEVVIASSLDFKALEEIKVLPV